MIGVFKTVQIAGQVVLYVPMQLYAISAVRDIIYNLMVLAQISALMAKRFGIQIQRNVILFRHLRLILRLIIPSPLDAEIQQLPQYQVVLYLAQQLLIHGHSR